MAYFRVIVLENAEVILISGRAELMREILAWMASTGHKLGAMSIEEIVTSTEQTGIPISRFRIEFGGPLGLVKVNAFDLEDLVKVC